MSSLKTDALPTVAKRPTDAAEGLAIGGALGCLVHCLLLPVLVAWIPSAGRALSPSFDLHFWLVLIIGPVSAWLLANAVRRYKAPILAAGLGGLGLLILALVLPLSAQQETLLSVAGSIMLAGAHIANWAVRHRGCGTAG